MHTHKHTRVGCLSYFLRNIPSRCMCTKNKPTFRSTATLSVQQCVPAVCVHRLLRACISKQRPGHTPHAADMSPCTLFANHKHDYPRFRATVFGAHFRPRPKTSTSTSLLSGPIFVCPHVPSHPIPSRPPVPCALCLGLGLGLPSRRTPSSRARPAPARPCACSRPPWPGNNATRPWWHHRLVVSRYMCARKR